MHKLTVYLVQFVQLAPSNFVPGLQSESNCEVISRLFYSPQFESSRPSTEIGLEITVIKS